MQLHGARHVDFDSCVFQHIGSFALQANQGSQYVNITRNTFVDLSGGAVLLGAIDDYAAVGDQLLNRYFVVQDNSISHTGVEYAGAPALMAGYVAGTVLAHNDIHDASYSGVSLGWGWGREISYARSNQVAYNHIYRVMTRLVDGGCIYTLGPQPDSVVHDNYLHDQQGDGAHPPRSLRVPHLSSPRCCGPISRA